jgi:hypothetical protein
MTDPGSWSAPDPQNDPRRYDPRYQDPQGPAQQPEQGVPHAPPPPPGPGWGPGPQGYGKPGVIPLRPLGVGEILDGAISTMRKHAAIVFGSSAVVAVISALLNLAAGVWVLDELNNALLIDPNATQQEAIDQAVDALGTSLASTGVTLVISILTQTFLAGFLTVVVGRAVLGRPINFTEVWGELKPRLLPLFGLTLVVTLLVTVGVVLCILPGVWLWVLFGLATPALVLERGAIGQAMTRSRELVRGSWWRIFGILLLALVIVMVIGTIIQLPFGLAIGLFSETATLTVGDLVLSELAAAVGQVLTVPFGACVTALLYIDQRMRKEGLDIELARSAGTAQ